MSSSPVNASPDIASPVNVGDVLADKYQVERVLGVGGMGVVVAAKHLTLGERVAIKFLLPQAMERADVVARFLREGQASARLRSEHITRVHDVGKLATGAPYLVMEYLDGQDLGVILRDKGPLSPERAVDFVMQACEALAEAHAAGVIHRDLKPSNLFVIRRLDGTPSIKLIDFGISKVSVPSAEGMEGEMTATAVMMGSPLYMAPEQMASARDVDARADIWSLGIILHTLLTGLTPFRAATVMGVYEQIVQGAPPIRRQRADVPEGLEAAILRCLQKDRRQRFANVGELAEALAPFGPPDARAAASRIQRIILVRGPTGSIPPPPPDDMAAPVAAATPATPQPSAPANTAKPAGSEGTKAAGSAGASQATGSSLALDPHATDGPWDQRTRPPSSSRRKGVLVIAAVAAIAIGAPAAFFALRGQGGSKVSPAVDATSVASTTPTALPSASATASSNQPSVSPAGPAPTTTDAPAVTASAAQPTQPAASARAPRPAAPATAQPKQPKQRSAEDLFGTQK
ncbi:MAG: serine/threonine-protein kinase [Minicystis sp.]